MGIIIGIVGAAFAVRGRSLWHMAAPQQALFAAAAAVGGGKRAAEHRGFTTAELVVRLYAVGQSAWHGEAPRGGRFGRTDWHWCAMRGGKALADYHEFAHTAAAGSIERCKCGCGAAAKSVGDGVARWRYDGGSPVGSMATAQAAATANIAAGVAQVYERLVAAGHDDATATAMLDATPSLAQAREAAGYDTMRALLMARVGTA